MNSHKAWEVGSRRLLECLTTYHFLLIGNPFTFKAIRRFSLSSAATVWADIMAIPIPAITDYLIAASRLSLLPLLSIQEIFTISPGAPPLNLKDR